jgi:hypothetical protein
MLEKKCEDNETVHQLFIKLNKAHYSVTREALCNILIKFGVTMKLVRLIKMRFSEVYGEFYIGKHLSISFIPKMF